jgi:hypothetical protein
VEKIKWEAAAKEGIENICIFIWNLPWNWGREYI